MPFKFQLESGNQNQYNSQNFSIRLYNVPRYSFFSMETQTIDVTKSVVFDLVLLCIIGIFNIILVTFIKPTKRGFFCDDESIRYPRHDSTVPSIVLNIFGISIPLILIYLVELKRARKDNLKKGPIYVMRDHKISFAFWNIYRMVLCYASGAVFTELLTDVGKITIGRLRPNFMDVCKPKNLSNSCPPFSYNYIENYVCEEDEAYVNKSRVSFPSGHTSFSFYVAVFLVLYLQKNWRIRMILVKPITQFLLIALAWFIGLSRVMDNKHHWSDVTAGMILGISVALINTIIIHRLFDPDKNEKVNGYVTDGAAINTRTEANDQV